MKDIKPQMQIPLQEKQNLKNKTKVYQILHHCKTHQDQKSVTNISKLSQERTYMLHSATK